MDHLDHRGPAPGAHAKRRATLRGGRASLTATTCRPGRTEHGGTAVEEGAR